MESKRLKSVWLGLKHDTFKQWTWTDGAKMSSEIPGGNHGCGGVSTVAGSLRAMECNYGGDHEGVVCENDYGCPASEKCFQEDDQSFLYKCGVSNWYKARDMCKDLNSTIAKLNTTKKINALVTAKTMVPSMILCGFFWIGVRRGEWYTMRSGAKSIVTRTSWDHGEPAVGKNCAVTSLVEGKLMWSAVDCAQQYIAVCMPYPTPSSPVQENIISTMATTWLEITHPILDTTKRSEVDDNPGSSGPLRLLIIIPVTVVVVALVLGALCFGCCLWRKSKQKRKSTSQENEEAVQAEKLQSIFDCDNESKHLLTNPESDGITPSREASVSFGSGRKAYTEEINRMKKDGEEMGNRKNKWKEKVHHFSNLISSLGGSIKITTVFKRGDSFILSPVTIIPLKKQDNEPCGSVQVDKTVGLGALLETIFGQEVKSDTLTNLLVQECDILVMDTLDRKTFDYVKRYTFFFKNICVLMPAKCLGSQLRDHAISVAAIETPENGEVVLDHKTEYIDCIMSSSQRPTEYDDVTWCAALAVALLLMRARAKKFSEEELGRLKVTYNMRRVLREMTIKSDKEEISKYRIFSPEKLLTDWASIREVIHETIGKNST